ncbi:MAG: ABC transporter substrate-binding protein [Candidatus Thorarchaeota archaeon]
MKKKSLYFIMLVIASLGISSMLNLGVANVQQNTKIKIGGLGPLEITPGKDMEKGLKLAVKDITDDGGFTVGGTTYDFDLIIETTSDPNTGLPDPATGTLSMNKLQQQDDVLAIIGGFRTEVVVQLQTLLNRPFLGLGSTAPIITPYFWRVSPTNGSELTRALLDFYAFGLAPQKSVKNVTIVREEAAWSLAMSTGLKFYLNYYLPTYVGLPVLNFTSDIVIPVTSDLDAVSSAMTPIKSGMTEGKYPTGYLGSGKVLNVNAIMEIFSGPVGANVPKAWAALNMTQILAGINVESQASTYFDETQGACYGEIEYETAPPDLKHIPALNDYRDAYLAEYGETPTYTAVAAYDAVMLLKEAIVRAGTVDSEAVQAELLDTDYQGIVARIKFTSEPNVWTHPIFGYPYGQVAYYDNGSRYVIPGVPTNLTVHDLYTPLTVGVRGQPYATGYMAQWQKGGVKRTIWFNGTSVPLTENLTEKMEWPIVHSEHGWVSATEPTPSFGFLLVLIVCTSAVLLSKNKRRK